MYAVIRIRGSVNVDRRISDTLDMLRLSRVNHCVIVPKGPGYEGMLKKACAYLTWGEISRDTLERLIAKRGRLPGDARVPGKDAKAIAKKVLEKGIAGAGIKPVFRLSPPSKGFRSVRTGYPKGDLGNRGEGINELLKRMI